MPDARLSALDPPLSTATPAAGAAFYGHLRLRAARRANGRTVLAEQSFRAPFHLSKPYWDADAGVLIAQVVNPTAGILAGDQLSSEIAVDAGAALLVTTPSASRVFKMAATESAGSRQHFSVVTDGWLELMPEPLVPHRGSRFRQVTTVDVAGGGGLFFVDQLQPGRVGHGEVWLWERLALELTVRLDGELILRERLDQTGVSLRDLAELNGSGPAACFANAILIGSSTDDSWRTELSALHHDGVWVGVSALRKGGWSLKLVAPDAVRLRATLRAARAILARQFPRLSCDPRKL